MRIAPPIHLTPGQRKTLVSQARARRAPARTVERARIVLLAASGLQDKQIAAQLKITPEKVARWRKRFLAQGLPALEKDAPRPGRTRLLTPGRVQEVLRKTTQPPPSSYPRWSARTMARAVGLSERSIRRIWSRHGLRP